LTTRLIAEAHELTGAATIQIGEVIELDVDPVSRQFGLQIRRYSSNS
jgi:hypothetical protein